MSKAFLDLLSNSEMPANLDPAEKIRLRKRLKILKEDPEPALLLKSWLRKRAEVHSYSINIADLARLGLDAGVIPSGVSDSRSGLTANNFFEGYARKRNIESIEKRHLLVPSEKPNVILRIVDEELPRPIPYGYVLVDLADHYEVRDRAQVLSLLQKL